jgi:hypothetical protein
MTRDLLPAAITVIFCAAILNGCSGNETTAPAPDTITVAFRDGVDPSQNYYGTRDAMLKDGPTTELLNGNFGYMDIDTLGTVTLGAELFERRMILKFDLSPITDCASVYSASLTLSISREDTSGITLAVYEATVPPAIPASWTEGLGGVAAGVSWQTVDGSYLWVSEGGDYLLPVMDIEPVGGDTTVTFELPADRVRRWIGYPYTNHGVLIRPLDNDEETFFRVYMRESVMPSLRPELIVRYRKSG